MKISASSHPRYLQLGVALLLLINFIILVSIGKAVADYRLKQLNIQYQAAGYLFEAHPELKEDIVNAFNRPPDPAEAEEGKSIVTLLGSGITDSMLKWLPQELATLSILLTAGILCLFVQYIRFQNMQMESWKKIAVQWQEGNTMIRFPPESGILGKQFNDLSASIDLLVQDQRYQREASVGILRGLQQECAAWIHNIKTYNEILAEEWRQKRSVPEYLAKSDLELKRLENLLDDLEQITILEAGETSLHLVTLNLKSMMDEVMQGFIGRARKQGVRLQVTCTNDLPFDCDEDRLYRALETLLRTALDCTDRNDTVNLACTSSPDLIKIEISFTGKGLAPEDIPNLFVRYYRGRLARSQHNTGLELALAQTIVQCHGGTISASNKPGSGGQFTIIFPIATEQSEILPL